MPRMLLGVLFVALLPSLLLAIGLGILVHPLFFLILVVVILALPAIAAVLRKPPGMNLSG